MKLHIPRGATSRIITVFVQANNVATGAGLSGLDQASGIVGGYVREGSVGVALAVDENVTTEGTYQAPTTVGQVRIGTPANMRAGTYELHFHNDLWASGAESVVITLGGAANMAELTLEVQLIDPVRGLGSPTALPNAAAGAVGGIPLPIWSGTLDAVTDTTVEFPTGYGISTEAQILVEIRSAGAHLGRSRFATYSGVGDVWTVDKAWNADGETTPTGTPLAHAYPVPAEPATNPPRVDVRQWMGGTPNALQAGRVDGYLGAVAAGAIAAASFAANALDAVWSTASRLLTAGTNIVLAKGTGVTGFNDPTSAATATAVRAELAVELTRVDAAISTRAATGAAMTLTADERTAIAEAHMGVLVETGLTVRQWARLTASVLFGKSSGHAAGAPIYRDVGDTKARITATVDADGNRTAITRDPD